MNRLNIKQTMALGTGRIGIAARIAEFLTIKLGSISASRWFSIIIKIEKLFALKRLSLPNYHSINIEILKIISDMFTSLK